VKAIRIVGGTGFFRGVAIRRLLGDGATDAAWTGARFLW
jgi:hypothetical protein